LFNVSASTVQSILDATSGFAGGTTAAVYWVEFVPVFNVGGDGVTGSDTTVDSSPASWDGATLNSDDFVFWADNSPGDVALLTAGSPTGTYTLKAVSDGVVGSNCVNCYTASALSPSAMFSFTLDTKDNDTLGSVNFDVYVNYVDMITSGADTGDENGLKNYPLSVNQDVPVVPEPSGIWLCLPGVALLALFGKRRRQRSS
jgi:hypothetical protein